MQKIAHLFFILIFFLSSNLLAQEAYTISGIVVDEKHNPINGATVFISGSKKITATDIGGRFTFNGMAAGNYIISTTMLGYSTPSQSVTVRDKSLSITITMTVKPIMLNEVSIGIDNNWEKHYSLFKDQFLGTSGNAKHCVILNPEIIHFSSERIGSDHMLLEADVDDLLVIENKRLGYKVKYLLKTFNYNSETHNTFYNGDSYFEELEGTDKQKKVWAQNRLTAYRGSLMHFLRSVFAKTVLNEGFITNQMVKSGNQSDMKSYINPSPVNFDTLVSTVDSSFVLFKFTALNIVYNPKKAARLQKREIKKQENNSQDNSLTVDLTRKSSQLLLHSKEAIVDARGIILTDYSTFSVRGNWAHKRIGNQLPFEYLPPKIAN